MLPTMQSLLVPAHSMMQASIAVRGTVSIISASVTPPPHPPPTPCSPLRTLASSHMFVLAAFGTWTCAGPDPVVVDDDAYAAVKAGGCLGQCLLLGDPPSLQMTALHERSPFSVQCRQMLQLRMGRAARLLPASTSYTCAAFWAASPEPAVALQAARRARAAGITGGCRSGARARLPAEVARRRGPPRASARQTAGCRLGPCLVPV